uniref:Uncharacterized protein n=1 Tax=Octopus bimaculoides TaxID=37653 RepID=A0A0L8I5J2_OCTBM
MQFSTLTYDVSKDNRLKWMHSTFPWENLGSALKAEMVESRSRRFVVKSFISCDSIDYIPLKIYVTFC